MAADGDALWVPPVVLVIEVMTVWCSALGDRFMRGERGRGQWAGSFIASFPNTAGGAWEASLSGRRNGSDHRPLFRQVLFPWYWFSGSAGGGYDCLVFRPRRSLYAGRERTGSVGRQLHRLFSAVPRPVAGKQRWGRCGWAGCISSDSGALASTA